MKENGILANEVQTREQRGHGAFSNEAFEQEIPLGKFQSPTFWLPGKCTGLLCHKDHMKQHSHSEKKKKNTSWPKMTHHLLLYSFHLIYSE